MYKVLNDIMGNIVVFWDGLGYNQILFDFTYYLFSGTFDIFILPECHIDVKRKDI